MNKESILQNIFIGLVCVCLLVSAAFAQTTAFNFQGRLNDGANPANGNVELQFKLFDALAGGNQIGADISRPGVAVNNGIFSASLDFGAAAFDGSPRFVEIGVRPAGSGNPFTILDPRQPILATPYSIQAKNAATADTAIDSTKLGGVNASEYVTTTTVGNSFIKNATTQQTGNFNINGNGVIGGRLGIGIAAPRSALDVTGVALLSPGGSGGGTMQFSQSNSETAMSFVGGNNRADIRYDGTTLKLLSNGGPLSPDSNYGININNLGNVGIGTTTPSPGIRLEVNGNALLTPGGSGGAIQFGTPNGETGMSIAALIGRADFRYDGTTLKLVANGGGGPPSSANGIAINNLGKVGVGTNTPQAKFHVVGTSWFQGDTTPLPAAAGKGIIVGFSGEQGYISSFDYGTFTPKNLLLNLGGGNVGIGTTTPQAKLDVAGTTKTNILQITGGSDLAEDFEIADNARPGMVVAIAPKGRLSIARGAYNTRVAGIISGANNLSAGMILPNLPGAKRSMPVALNGRVWVYSDATRQPIKAGDLLTTSNTPGYAMKAANYRRAQGAIIGKAMTELKSGKGLVLVLVSLQ
jgi:hypothetical protein